MRLSIIILSLISTIFATSCSAPKRAQWHYKKALKNGLKLVQDSDTIRIATIDSIPVIKNDTIVWEKFIAYRDTVIKYNNIYVPKTRWQTRIEYKERVKTLKIKGDTQWKTAKAKQVVKYKWAWWPIVISFILGILLRFLIQKGLLDRIALLFKL
jgi:PBP1b-binding outer membrane lipoprotein LpoB